MDGKNRFTSSHQHSDKKSNVHKFGYMRGIKPTVDWMGNQQLKNKHKDAIETSPIHKIKNNV